MTDLASLITRDSDLSGYSQRRHGLPSTETFVGFIAQSIKSELPSLPTAIALEVDWRANHVFNLSGHVSFGDDTKLVSGEIVSLARMGCFRGHVILDPKGKVTEGLPKTPQNAGLNLGNAEYGVMTRPNIRTAYYAWQQFHLSKVAMVSRSVTQLTIANGYAQHVMITSSFKDMSIRG